MGNMLNMLRKKANSNDTRLSYSLKFHRDTRKHHFIQISSLLTDSWLMYSKFNRGKNVAWITHFHTSCRRLCGFKISYLSLPQQWRHTKCTNAVSVWRILSNELLVHFVGISFMSCDFCSCGHEDVGDVQRTMGQIRSAAQIAAVCAASKRFSVSVSSCLLPFLLFLSCSSKTKLNRLWGCRNVRKSETVCRPRPPVDSRSWTRGSLINCLLLIVALFWSSETSKTTWNNLTCLNTFARVFWDPPYSTPPYHRNQKPLSVFLGCWHPEEAWCHLSTPHLCCKHIVPFLAQRVHVAACGLNSSVRPSLVSL